jgi:hypothetical protein
MAAIKPAEHDDAAKPESKTRNLLKSGVASATDAVNDRFSQTTPLPLPSVSPPP